MRDRLRVRIVFAVESLRGQLLIAGPKLIDPNFRRTVVLVGEHGEEGAMGVVLNRPSPVSVEEAVPPLSILDGLHGGADPVYVGGPVQPQAVVVLGEFAEPERAATLVFDSIGFLPAEADPDSFGELTRSRVFAGYAGWAPGQLEGELEEKSWILEPALADDVFTDVPDGLWSGVLHRKGGPFAVLATMPPDPSLN
jgi:putative transcriptional regulator